MISPIMMLCFLSKKKSLKRKNNISLQGFFENLIPSRHWQIIIHIIGK